MDLTLRICIDDEVLAHAVIANHSLKIFKSVKNLPYQHRPINQSSRTNQRRVLDQLLLMMAVYCY